LVPLLLSGAERNVTVQWQGEFGCLSFCLSWTAIILWSRIKIIKVDDGNCISWEMKVNTGTVINVYWSNSNIRTATGIITIIHNRTDKNYRAFFCSRLSAIHTKWHTTAYEALKNPLFHLHGLLLYVLFL